MNFDKNKYQELKVSYNEAVKNKEDQFNFHNEVLNTSFAKYLIEYLSYKFNNKKT